MKKLTSLWLTLLLALGAVGGDAAAAALRAYVPPEPAGPEEQKHCEQIAAAHRLALDRCCAETPAPLHSLRAPREALLRPPAGLAEALLDELDDTVERISKYPYAHELYRTARPMRDEIRKVPVKGYVLYYAVLENTVEIRRFLHGRRNRQDLEL